tara:strand:- start:965 stop:1597 length:633 start_codon:yes stop_codon:yes gene_type:complete
MLLGFIFIGCENLFNDDTLYGCLDETACNYSSIANTNDSELCEYPLEYYNCDGDCVAGLDQCGVCGGNGMDSDQDGICDDNDPCIGLSQDGYSCTDIQVLYDFININPSLSDIDVDAIGDGIGIANWEDGRLTYLSLANLDIDYVPYSISLLDALEILFLNNNNINSLPPTFCLLPNSCTIFIQNNNLCPEYQTSEWNCINQFSPQDCQE